jgi:CDGSH-type Zn-finger protein
MGIKSLMKKSEDYEVEREGENFVVKNKKNKKVYSVILSKNGLICDCKHSSIKPNSICSHKIAVIKKLLEIAEMKNE